VRRVGDRLRLTMRKRRIWCQVWYIWGQSQPYTVIPLKMISLAKSMGDLPFRYSEQLQRDAIARPRTPGAAADRHAGHLAYESAPSPTVSASHGLHHVSLGALIVTCAPLGGDRARTLGINRRRLITLEAPAASAMPTAKQPIGQHPTMKTEAAGNYPRQARVERIHHRVLIAPTSCGDGAPIERPERCSRHRDVLLGECPSRSTPDDARVLGMMWLLPVRNWKAYDSRTSDPRADEWTRPIPCEQRRRPTRSRPANSWPTTIDG